MSRRKKQILIENLEISGIAAEGKSLGRYEGKVVFVKYTLPGDIVDVSISRDRKKYMEGHAVLFRKYSEKRIAPFCSHFGLCGGCTWQHLPYEDQLNFKQQEISENLLRIGKVELPEIPPVKGSPENVYYRNKLEFTFSSHRWLTREEIGSGLPADRNALGFHIPEKFDKIFDVDKCWLQPDLSNTIRLFVKEKAVKKGLSFYDPYTREGLMRNLTIRNNQAGEFMVILSVREPVDEVKALLDELELKFADIVSIYYVVNTKVNDSLTDLEPVLYKGMPYLTEVMEGLHFRISPKSFFQTNTVQALTLYRTVREFAGLTGIETVYDLYTGTGTIALFVSRHCGKVVGMDYVEEAITDAKANSDINGITNAEFYAGNVLEMFSEQFVERHGKPEVLITDPPRAGMHKDVVEGILKTEPSRIVYVSCNSATQARDIDMLSGHYRLVKLQAVDMFPHTYHIENVVLLERKV